MLKFNILVLKIFHKNLFCNEQGINRGSRSQNILRMSQLKKNYTTIFWCKKVILEKKFWRKQNDLAYKIFRVRNF